VYWTFAEIIITFYQKAHKFVTLTYLSAKPTSQLKRQYILFFNRMSKLHVFKWIRDKQATVWLWKHVYCLAFTALYDKLQVSKPLRWKLIPELDAVIRSWCDVRSQIDPQACSLVYWVWPGAFLTAISLNSTHDTPICVRPHSRHSHMCLTYTAYRRSLPRIYRSDHRIQHRNPGQNQCRSTY
jgi:hypothetical protein